MTLRERFQRARQIREEILTRLREEAPADGAFLITLASLKGCTAVAASVASGEPAARGIARFCLLPADVIDSVLSGNRDRQSRRTHRTFVDWDHLLPPDHPQRLAVFRDVWRASGVRDLARMVVFDGNAVAVSVSIVRTDARFVASDRRRLAGIAADVSDELVEAWKLERAIAPAGDESVVLDEDGHTAFVSGSARPWLDIPGLHDTISAGVRALRPTGEASSLVPWGPITITLTRLRGKGRDCFLARFHVATAVTRAEDAVLSPVQREVAKLAASGATVAEIAASLNRGTETVRSHLSAIYRRLGVSTRVELARALDAERHEKGEKGEKTDDDEVTVW